MHPNDHCNTIYNSQDMKASKVSTDRFTDREDVVYIYTMGYYSAIKRMK